jgi:hypothetical protein
VTEKPGIDESAAGELRINRLRLAGLVAFYGLYLLKIYVFKEKDSILPQYRTGFTVLTAAWLGMALGLQVCLSRRWVPAWHKYAVVTLDLVFVTAFLALAADPWSPLLGLYLLVLASTPLRRSPRLVGWATAAAILGYCGLLGYYVLGDVGAQEYFSNPAVRIPGALPFLVVLVLLGGGCLAFLQCPSRPRPV